MTSQSTAAWQERLWYAYAESLVKDGRAAEAVTWFSRAASHPEKGTDADMRLAALRSGDEGTEWSWAGEFVDLDDGGDPYVEESPMVVDRSDEHS